MTSGVAQSGLYVDLTDLQRLAQALRKVAPAAARELRKDMLGIGELVKKRAAQNLLGIPSQASGDVREGIAQSLRVRTAGLTVKVTAGESASSASLNVRIMAGLEEHGGRANPASWSHPLFGDLSYTYDEQAHPYLVPALHDEFAAVVVKVGESLDKALTVLEETHGD
jgi:hypothetical protein